MSSFKKIKATLLVFSIIGLAGFSSQSYAWWWKWFSPPPPPTYAKTQYPIVLVPGAFGFDKLLFIDYWYGIADEMRSEGAEVYVVDISGFSTHVIRGEELRENVESILAITGAKKVNLIGHSQGSPTSRYLASTSDMVASVTSVHGWNESTFFTDGFGDFLEIPVLGKTAEKVLDGVLELTEWVSQFNSPNPEYNSPRVENEQSVKTLVSQGKDYFQAFNELYPEGMPTVDCTKINGGYSGNTGGGDPVVKGVHYYSWGGNKKITSAFDIVENILYLVFKAFTPNERNLVWDIVVPGCGQALGDLIRDDYNANHLDGVNQVFGIVPWNLNPPSIFTNHANRLKKAGL